MADPKLQHKLVLIQDSLLDSMAADVKFSRELPFLKGLLNLPRPATCRSCNRGQAQVVRQQTYASAKRTMAGLPAEKKRKLKELLNAKQIRIIFRNDGGKIIELTF